MGVVVEDLDTVLEHIWILVISSVAGLTSLHQPLQKRLFTALIVKNEVNLEELVLQHHGLSNISGESVDQKFL